MAYFILALTTVILIQLGPCYSEDSVSTVPPVADNTCPSGCLCMAMEGQGYISDCNNQGFTVIPDTLPVSSSQIYLKGNSIRVITKDALGRYPYLRNLVITESGLEELTPGAFAAVRELTAIDLKDNQISVLRDHIFSGLKKLQKVVLDRNRLSTIENYAFKGIGTDDEGVSLSIVGNPELAHIHEHAFDGANIQELIIRNCSLTDTSLISLRALKNLSLLFLEDNRIPLTIPAAVFTGFHFHGVSLANNGIKDTSFLEHLSAGMLSLTNNPIGPVNFSQYTDLAYTRELHLGSTTFNTIHPQYFTGMTRLSDLDLSSNGITSLPEQMKPVLMRLQKLSLAGNPLHCNCDLSWFRVWLTSKSHKVLGAECVTPFKADPLAHADHTLFSCSPPTSVRIARQLEGGTATLVCRANGDPPPTLTWTTPDGELISPPLNSHNYTGKAKAQLPLTETNKSGLYSCEASNRKGSSSDSIKVDVDKTIALARTDQRSHANNIGHGVGLNVFTVYTVCWMLSRIL